MRKINIGYIGLLILIIVVIFGIGFLFGAFIGGCKINELEEEIKDQNAVMKFYRDTYGIPTLDELHINKLK